MIQSSQDKKFFSFFGSTNPNQEHIIGIKLIFLIVNFMSNIIHFVSNEKTFGGIK